MSKPDPKARTSAPPQIVDGVTFHCYRTGVARTAWISEDGRVSVSRNYHKTTYSASVDDKYIAGGDPRQAKRFRTQSAAMLAAVLYAKRASR